MKFGKNELNLIFIIFYFLKLKAFLFGDKNCFTGRVIFYL